MKNFAAKLKQANLVNKTDFDEKPKKLDKKITSNNTKHVLVENQFKKLQTSDSSLFVGQNYFNNDGAQLYLILRPIYETVTTFSGLPNIISEWEFKGLLKLNLLIQQIKFFLQNCNGINLD